MSVEHRLETEKTKYVPSKRASKKTEKKTAAVGSEESVLANVAVNNVHNSEYRAVTGESITWQARVPRLLELWR